MELALYKEININIFSGWFILHCIAYSISKNTIKSFMDSSLY